MYYIKKDSLLFLDNQLSGMPKQSIDWSLILRMLGQFFFLIAIFCIVIFLAYWITRYIGKAKFLKQSIGNMQIIESMAVGFNNAVLLIKVGEQFFLISAAKDRVSFLTEIDSESIHLNLESKGNNVRSFFEVQLADKIKKIRGNKKN